MREAGAKDVLGRLVALAERAIAATRREAPDAEILGVGVGAPGPLDTKRGIVLLTPNLGWVNLPLRQIIHDRLGLPAALDNDANCAVLGEWWVGAARGARTAIGITIGTGIGGGLILDGKLFHGASDVAGEIGHTTIDTEGRRCKCGNYGCLEAYASGPNIALRAVEEIEAGAVSRLPSLVGGDLTKITAQTVYQAAADGDDLALEVVNDTAKFLGVGHRQPAQRVQSRSRGGVRRRDARRGSSVRAAPPRGGAARLQARGGRVPHRAGRARRHGGRVRGGEGVPGPDGRGCLRSASSGRWSGTSSTDGIRWHRPPRSGAASPTRWAGSMPACPPTGRSCRSSRSAAIWRRRRPSCSRGLSRLTPGGRCVEVPAPNNRVVLHYQSAERRCERMSGGVPGWTWLELGPMVQDLDALYLNFISGFELALGTAQALRQGFRGPIYADLHSLFLGMQHDGMRVLQPLADAAAWFGCFDVVQLNEDEMRQLSPDPLSLSAQALGAGVSLLVVTLGPKGAAYVAAPGFDGWTTGRAGGRARRADGPRDGRPRLACAARPLARAPARHHSQRARPRTARSRSSTPPAAATCSGRRRAPGCSRATTRRPRWRTRPRWPHAMPGFAGRAA